MKGIIKLEGLDFFAYHGYYDEERKTGNKYTVDIALHVTFEKRALNDQLTGTVDYEKIYAIVNKIMDEPTKLLETLANRINQKIMREFDSIVCVETAVSKHNPPIGGVCSRVKVVIKSERSS